MRVGKGKSTAEASLATMSLAKQQKTNNVEWEGMWRDCTGRDVRDKQCRGNQGEPAKLVSYNRVRFEVKCDQHASH